MRIRFLVDVRIEIDIGTGSFWDIKLNVPTMDIVDHGNKSRRYDGKWYFKMIIIYIKLYILEFYNF